MIDLRSTFGFHSTPFTREIRAEDCFSIGCFDEPLDGLVRCIEARMSAALIAPAGTGKTKLLGKLHARLPEARYRVRYVKVTDLGKRDMCREIAAACGIAPATTYPQLVHNLQDSFLSTVDADGRRPVILVDEAHELRPDVLAMFRVLTNFEMDSRLVLSVVLCGQPPLHKMLCRDGQEAIARRIFYYAQLRLLSRDEIVRYVSHRCTIAGATVVPFDDGALDALYEIGRGNLRATDSLALGALERAALAKMAAVSANLVAAARKDVMP
jgi:general secretion pathway protein A